MKIRGKGITGILTPIILLGILVLVGPSTVQATTVSIKDASAPQGSTVTVPINITDVTDMCGANIWLSYDKTVVTVEKVDNGDLGSVTHNIDNDAGITKMTWDTTEGDTGSFVFAYITLNATGSARQTSPLDLDVKELYRCDLSDITHTVADGTFTIPPLLTPTLTVTPPPSVGGVGSGGDSVGILPTPTPTLTPTLSPTPAPSLSSTPAPTPSPAPSFTPTATLSPTPKPGEVPGFDVCFAILGLLAGAYFLRRRMN